MDTLSQKRLADKILALFPNGCKKVLFVIPPESPMEEFRVEVAKAKRYPCFPPYGAGLLARYLDEQGLESSILDLNFHWLSHAHSIDAQENFNSNIWHEKLIGKLNEFQPEMIAISCMFTMTHRFMIRIAEACKEFNPKLVVLVGGVHVSNSTKLILEGSPSVDLASKFEADKSFPDLLAFINKVKTEQSLVQIAGMVDGQYVELTERVKPLPLDLELNPQYSDLDIGKYSSLGQIGTYTFMYPGRKAATAISNRGCRARCTFCSVRTFNGMGVRGRTITAVADEIEMLVDQYEIQHIMWLDDDLLYDGDRAIKLFNEITRRKLGITWDASNGIIAAAITRDIMDAAVASGCIGMNLGIESGDPSILRSVKKPGTVDSYRKAAEILRCYPQVFVKAFLIIGFPNETVQQLLNTINLCLELQYGWHAIAILTPLPSTEIYKTMLEQGLIEDNLETSNSVNSIVTRGKLWAREQMEKMNAKDFFNLFLTAQLDHVPSRDELRDYWFLADYKLNYERLIHEPKSIRLANIAAQLRDICDRMTHENALGNLFLAVVEDRFDNTSEAMRRLNLAKFYLAKSNYWQKRFETLDLFSLVQSLEAKLGSQNTLLPYETPISISPL